MISHSPLFFSNEVPRLPDRFKGILNCLSSGVMLTISWLCECNFCHTYGPSLPSFCLCFICYFKDVSCFITILEIYTLAVRLSMLWHGTNKCTVPSIKLIFIIFISCSNNNIIVKMPLSLHIWVGGSVPDRCSALVKRGQMWSGDISELRCRRTEH